MVTARYKNRRNRRRRSRAAKTEYRLAWHLPMTQISGTVDRNAFTDITNFTAKLCANYRACQQNLAEKRQ